MENTENTENGHRLHGNARQLYSQIININTTALGKLIATSRRTRKMVFQTNDFSQVVPKCTLYIRVALVLPI